MDGHGHGQGEAVGGGSRMSGAAIPSLVASCPMRLLQRLANATSCLILMFPEWVVVTVNLQARKLMLEQLGLPMMLAIVSAAEDPGIVLRSHGVLRLVPLFDDALCVPDFGVGQTLVLT